MSTRKFKHLTHGLHQQQAEILRSHHVLVDAVDVKDVVGTVDVTGVDGLHWQAARPQRHDHVNRPNLICPVL